MNLKSLFAGRYEAAEEEPKRGPGRPVKVRKKEEEEDQEPDAMVEALQSMVDQPEEYDERLRLRHRKRKVGMMGTSEASGSCARALVEAIEKPVFLAEVRARADEGYSKRQFLSSLIPNIGTEVKVADAEVTVALQGRQVVFHQKTG